MVSSAKRLAVKTYQAEKCDRVTLDVPKGKREVYKAIAARLGLSLSMLVQHSVESYGANHAGEEFKPTTPAPMTAEERKLIEEFNALPDDVRKSISKLIRQINQIQPQN